MDIPAPHHPSDVWFRLAAAAMAALVSLLIGCSASKAPQPAASKKPAAQPDFTATLQSKLAVSGTATFVLQVKENYYPLSGSETWGEWSYDIAVENHTGEALALDATAFLVETDTTDTEYEGYMIVNDKRLREPRIPPLVFKEKAEGKGPVQTCLDHSTPFGLQEFEAFDGKTQVINVNGFTGKFNFCSPDKNKLAEIGPLASGATVHLKRTVKPFSWLDGKHRASVCFVLPEIHRGAAPNYDSYQPVVLMERQADLNNWKAGRLIVLHETATGLQSALNSDQYNLFTRVLAANRLAEYYPEQAGAAFASAAAGLRSGHLLASMIDLAARMKTDSLQEHCRGLASDRKVPKGISSRAKAYLRAVAAVPKKAS